MVVSAKQSALTTPNEEDLRVPCYCEENVWRLAVKRKSSMNHASTTSSDNACDMITKDDCSGDCDEKFRIKDLISGFDSLKDKTKDYVVFISNAEKCCAMFHQKAATPGSAVYWDYHVILISNCLVYDLDTTLKYPCDLSEYLSNSFDYIVPKKYEPRFRLITADDFLLHFSSDRSHMLDDTGSRYISPPPSYDCIDPVACRCGRKLKLSDCWRMTESETINMESLIRIFLPNK